MVDPGSFRDPAGVVLLAHGRVFRTIEESAWPQIDAVIGSGILDRLASEGKVVGCWPVTAADVPRGLTDRLPPGPRRLYEHERIPFIAYPYEWPFALLKRAALHQIDLHLELLASGFSLADASAYNVQFRGTRPVFIDLLAIRPYRDGEYWAGYRQFCEQYLAPLLLTAVNGVPHQAWLRGSPEGIPVEQIAQIIPLRAKLSWRVLTHVVLHASMTTKAQRAHTAQQVVQPSPRPRPMPKPALVWLLSGMRKWVAGLRPRDTGATAWRDYEQNTTYAPDETESKRAVVARFIERLRPKTLLDLGCNTGFYAEVALAAGATRVIGFDSDHGALEVAVARADAQHLDFLPLFLDAANPSPDQGWAQRERRGLRDRSRADGILALAFLHHLVIGHNVPMAQVVEWLVSLAPSGVVEFVPKDDPTVQRMLAHRDDIFPAYHHDAFRHQLARHAAIVEEAVVSSTGRTLIEFRR